MPPLAATTEDEWITTPDSHNVVSGGCFANEDLVDLVLGDRVFARLLSDVDHSDVADRVLPHSAAGARRSTTSTSAKARAWAARTVKSDGSPGQRQPE